MSSEYRYSYIGHFLPTLEDLYITPESSAVREAAKRAEDAFLKSQTVLTKGSSNSKSTSESSDSTEFSLVSNIQQLMKGNYEI